MADSVPSRLFKYQPYNTQTLDNPKNQVIWFSYPAIFNDPFDITIIPRLTEPSEEQWKLQAKQSREEYRRRGSHGVDYWDGLYLTDGKPNTEFRQMVMNSMDLSSGYMQVGNRTRGVACFSKTVDDILMWSHYADGHRGFCLEFDTGFAPLQDATKVVYDDHLPSLRLADAHKGIEFPNAALMSTKSAHWRYEQEWRVFSEQGNMKFEIDAAALTGIYFGCAMPSEHSEIIAIMLEGWPTQLYRMERSTTEFKVIPALIVPPYPAPRDRKPKRRQSPS